MHRTLINLAEIHYNFGLIGHDEFRERIRVALWLADAHPGSELDPRKDSDEKTPTKKLRRTTSTILSTTTSRGRWQPELTVVNPQKMIMTTG